MYSWPAPRRFSDAARPLRTANMAWDTQLKMVPTLVAAQMGILASVRISVEAAVFSTTLQWYGSVHSNSWHSSRELPTHHGGLACELHVLNLEWGTVGTRRATEIIAIAIRAASTTDESAAFWAQHDRGTGGAGAGNDEPAPPSDLKLVPNGAPVLRKVFCVSVRMEFGIL